MSLSQALRSLGRPVAYYPSLARMLTGVKAAILLGQLFYWQERSEAEDGFFYKSIRDLKEETGLSYKEQLAARAMLTRLGILKNSYRRSRHRLYYRIEVEALDALWEAYSQREDTHMPKGKMPYAQREDRSKAETTTETTKTLPPLSPRSAAPALLDTYHALFTARFGNPPVINGGKDGALMKRLVRQYGREKVEELLRAFFGSDDRWITGSGYTIGVFHASVNKLLAHGKQADRFTGLREFARGEGE